MYKICLACETLYKSAGYRLEPSKDIPEGTGKCDFCKKKRWLKAFEILR